MARLPIQLKKEDNRMSSGGGGWTRFGNNIGESIYNRGRPLCQLWCKWFVCKNEEKIKMIARQYVYSIHKKLGGAFSKGTIEYPWGVFSSKCWTISNRYSFSGITVYGNDETKHRDHFQIGSEGMSQRNQIRFEITQLPKKWFSRS